MKPCRGKLIWLFLLFLLLVVESRASCKSIHDDKNPHVKKANPKNKNTNFGNHNEIASKVTSSVVAQSQKKTKHDDQHSKVLKNQGLGDKIKAEESVSRPLLSTSERTGKRQAYISLLYGDFYTLPIRVMMHSLLKNSHDVAKGLRDRIVLVTHDVSEEARKQMRKDGIVVREVVNIQSPYTWDPKLHPRFLEVMTKLTIFNMTEYDKLIYLDADTLVFEDLSDAFDQASTAAVFINPCYFNSGMMVITPNTHLFNDMIRNLPLLESYDAADQGFLNSYFDNMFFSPICSVDRHQKLIEIHSRESHVDSDASSTATQFRNSICRLNPEWHVDHSEYYLHMSWHERKGFCKRRREIEYLGPPIGKPWVFMSASLLDLSVEWERYRKQLHDPFVPGMMRPKSLFALSVLAILGTCILWVLFAVWISRRCRTWHVSHDPILRRLQLDNDLAIPIFGVFGLLAFFFSDLYIILILIPHAVLLVHGVVLYVSMKFLMSSLIMFVLAALCALQVTSQDMQYQVSHSLQGALRVTLVGVLLQSLGPPVFVKLVNMPSYSTVWYKALVLGGGGVIAYVLLSFYYSCFVSFRWIQWAADDSQGHQN